MFGFGLYLIIQFFNQLIYTDFLYTYMDQGSLIGSGMKKITSQFYVDKSKQLGRGNFGVVYKGYQLSTNQIIAVKFVEKKILKKFPDYEREIVVMQDLAQMHHQNIMGYYGFQDNEEGLYCFLELCNGGTLKQLIKGKISQLKVVSLFKQLLDAMTYINSQNKVHRDLKPDNLMLDENGDLKIADFGLSRDVEAQMTKGVCTPLYAAPEVIVLDPYNIKCDVWSAGMILYEMLTGKEMFEHVKKKNELLKEIAKFSNPSYRAPIPKQLNPEWQKIIAKMLTHNEAKRPSFKELKEYFESVEPDLRAALIKKYGDQQTPTQQTQNQLRLTKTISPYQSNKNKNVKGNNLGDVALKLKEEKSFNFVNNCRKWLNFARQKIQIMVKLIKEFNNCTYPYAKNVHKYMLMFLSVSCYIARLTAHVNQIKAKKIMSPEGPITQDDIINSHINQFKQMLKQIEGKLEASIAKYKNILEKQIIQKIVGTYMKRPDEQKILQDCGNFVQLINKAKQGIYLNQQIYMQMFKKVSSSPGVHYSNNMIKQFKYQDLKVYSYIRIIACVDQAFINNHYKNDDYLRSKKQQIQNATQEELVQLISKFNIA